jgi:hypothetical protein
MPYDLLEGEKMIGRTVVDELSAELIRKRYKEFGHSRTENTTFEVQETFEEHKKKFMGDPFMLSVNYQDEQREYRVQRLEQGYTHRYKVWIGEAQIFFEPDEDDSYRAIKMPGQDEKMLNKIDRKLLLVLQQQLESMDK